MQTQEEYYQSTLQNRKLLADEEITKCPCPNTLCDWYGDCKACVALHRYHNDHIPMCLQHMLVDKISSLANIVEITTVKKDGTPIEYRKYVKQKDSEQQTDPVLLIAVDNFHANMIGPLLEDEGILHYKTGKTGIGIIMRGDNALETYRFYVPHGMLAKAQSLLESTFGEDPYIMEALENP